MNEPRGARIRGKGLAAGVLAAVIVLSSCGDDGSDVATDASSPDEQTAHVRDAGACRPDDSIPPSEHSAPMVPAEGLRDLDDRFGAVFGHGWDWRAVELGSVSADRSMLRAREVRVEYKVLDGAEPPGGTGTLRGWEVDMTNTRAPQDAGAEIYSGLSVNPVELLAADSSLPADPFVARIAAVTAAGDVVFVGNCADVSEATWFGDKFESSAHGRASGATAGEYFAALLDRDAEVVAEFNSVPAAVEELAWHERDPMQRAVGDAPLDLQTDWIVSNVEVVVPSTWYDGVVKDESIRSSPDQLFVCAYSAVGWSPCTTIVRDDEGADTSVSIEVTRERGANATIVVSHSFLYDAPPIAAYEASALELDPGLALAGEGDVAGGLRRSARG